MATGATGATPLKSLLGGQTAAKLAKHRDLHTVSDLLEFWPRRYKSHEDDLSHLELGEYVVVVAHVRSATTRPMRQRRGRMLNVVITDGRNDVDVTFFDARGHEQKLTPGTRAVFAGEVTRYQRRWQLAHPGYTLLDPHEDRDEEGLIPIYLQVPKLHNWTITECVRLVLDHLDDLPDAIPDEVRGRRRLMSRLEAVRAMHRPADWAQLGRARRRLRYDEALVLQCLLARRRSELSAERTAARRPQPGGLLESFDARLPFELTEGQREVGSVLADELARETPMHRLLQGEVGSGKTVVALRAMLAAVDAGGQAALLAPTPPSTTGRSRACSATSPREGCSAGARSARGLPS
jgi:ATP-dependent DNA helicase RecG